MISNVVNKETLRNVQIETMNTLKDILIKSFGPYGSNSIIYSGKDALPRYTKDGHTILSSVQFNGPIESSVLTDIEEETRTQAIKVGDSTTSVTILSALIFTKLAEYEDKSEIPPAELVRVFKSVANRIKEIIKSHGRNATLDDMYDIALISTNGDEDLAKELRVIYDNFGLDVYIDVKASVTGETYIKEINGMVLENGYMDTTFVNNPTSNTCELSNPNIYAFQDPIDTIEMGTYLDMIIEDNILKPARDNDFDSVVPTVILAPRLSKDFSAYIDNIIQSSAQAKATTRMPLNIITNIDGVDFNSYEDIAALCGCKFIKKYLDPEIQIRDIEKGYAIDVDNRASIHNMAGSSERVISDNTKTTFITPINMYNEDGTTSELFNQKISWLESEIKKETTESTETVTVYNLKKRLNSLKGNMVEVFVGGVTIADRDQARDLLEDAALNCRSAAKSGVGYGANFEGLRASSIVSDTLSGIEKDIATVIYDAYKEINTTLYNTAIIDEALLNEDRIPNVLGEGCPYNIRTNSFDKKVLSSIDTDIYALDTISKIVTIMATSNQFILPTVNLNVY